MNQGYPRLLGDIGGTNARWAWVAQAGDAPCDISVRPCLEHASPADSAREYLARHGHPAPNWIAIGVATPVTGDHVRLTNHPWSFSIAELQRALGAQRCLVINDFTALALSLPLLGAGELRAIGDNAARAPREGATLALLGPGTGLGVSGLLPVGGGWPISGEGGHATLAAADDEEAALVACLRRRFGHVSAERVLSGQGLVNLYEAVCALDKHPARALDAREVTRAALDATDEHCVRAVRLFTGLLGGVAGNLALTLGARGGLYIGGGIVPRLGAGFDDALFRARFEQKGRFANYLEEIPAWVITASTPALLGADRALSLWPS
ncbi:MAG TPA: glucokinase [Burkholderiaceae bacterium]|nr:glucokinase [Burkholderiaceae bacterium]